MSNGRHINHYLCQRGPEGLERIDIFHDGETAMEAYGQRERELTDRPHSLSYAVTQEVCLFGADSLLTLCKTHPSWFNPEALPEVFG